MRGLIWAAALLALLASPARADVDDDAQAWLTLAASGVVSGRVLGQAEAIARFSDDENGIYEAEFGGFLGLALTDRVSLWAGYVRVPRYARGGKTTVENRGRQQITAELGGLLGGDLSGRVRLEQRFRDGGGIGWRLRPQLKFSRPLSNDGVALVFSHESFVPLNDTGWGQRRGYERMRNFAGLQVPIADKLAAEVGYLNQYGFDPVRDTADHGVSTTFSYAF